MVFLSHGSNPKIDGSWAMAQTPQKWGPEPWLKPPKKEFPSHGSNPPKKVPWAMAQTPQNRGPEPWLKPQKRGSWAMALKVFRAMAQTPKKWGPEPWLKLNFVLHILTSKNLGFHNGSWWSKRYIQASLLLGLRVNRWFDKPFPNLFLFFLYT